MLMWPLAAFGRLEVLARLLSRELLRRPLPVGASPDSRKLEGPANDEGALADSALARLGMLASNSEAGMPVAAAKAAKTPDSLLEAVVGGASGLPRDRSSAAMALAIRGRK